MGEWNNSTQIWLVSLPNRSALRLRHFHFWCCLLWRRICIGVIHLMAVYAWKGDPTTYELFSICHSRTVCKTWWWSGSKSSECCCMPRDWLAAVDFDGTDSIIAVPPDALNIPIPQYFGCCCKMLIMPSRTEFDEFASDKWFSCSMKHETALQLIQLLCFLGVSWIFPWFGWRCNLLNMLLSKNHW